MTEQQESVELEIKYAVHDTEGGRYLEINTSAGCVDINLTTDLPMDALTLNTIIASLPSAVQQVLGQLQPEELA